MYVCSTESTYGDFLAIERTAFLYIGNYMTQRHYERRRSLELFQPPGGEECLSDQIEDEEGEGMVEQGDI